MSSARRPRAMHLMLSCAVVVLCVGCPGRAPAPSGTATAAPTTEPTAGATAPAPASTAAPATQAGAAGLALAPWLRDVFDPARSRTYAWTFSVDTHDEHGTVAEAAGKVRCSVEPPTRFELADGGEAIATCEACAYTPTQKDDVGFEPNLHECYVATGAGLWIVDEAPTDADAIGTLIQAPPYLAMRPVERQEGIDGAPYTDEDGMSVMADSVMVAGAEQPAWCRNDSSSEMYGSSATRCFGAGVGLFEVDLMGLSGPSDEQFEWIEGAP